MWGAFNIGMSSNHSEAFKATFLKAFQATRTWPLVMAEPKGERRKWRFWDQRKSVSFSASIPLSLSTEQGDLHFPIPGYQISPQSCFDFFKISHSKIKGRNIDFSFIPCPICVYPPAYQHSPPEWCIVTINKPTLTHHIHLKSRVYIIVHSWYCTFYRFEQM